MLEYTLCLIRQGTKILLLNRESSAWMGCWNGVGGKLEQGEQPRFSMLREIAEETQIDSPELHFKGLITWTTTEGIIINDKNQKKVMEKRKIEKHNFTSNSMQYYRLLFDKLNDILD